MIHKNVILQILILWLLIKNGQQLLNVLSIKLKVKENYMVFYNGI